AGPARPRPYRLRPLRSAAQRRPRHGLRADARELHRQNRQSDRHVGVAEGRPWRRLCAAGTGAGGAGHAGAAAGAPPAAARDLAHHPSGTVHQPPESRHLRPAGCWADRLSRPRRGVCSNRRHDMNSTIVTIVTIVALAVVAVILFMGLWNMFRGGEGSGNRSQTLMRARVIAQFVAIVVIL